MAFDPNAPTSDIGMMYRQALQARGAPLTQSNLQALISQSQREPGMIAGLSVQQPGGMHADAPPNIAQASPRMSGAPAPPPQAMPTGIPPTQAPAPFPRQAPTEGDMGPPRPMGSPMVDPGGAPPAPQPASTAPSLINAANAGTVNLPGQTGVPPSGTMGQGVEDPLSIITAALAGGGASMYGLRALLGRGAPATPPGGPLATIPNAANTTPENIARAVNGGGEMPTPVTHPNVMPGNGGKPSGPVTHPNVMPEVKSDPATEVITNPLKDKPAASVASKIESSNAPTTGPGNSAPAKTAPATSEPTTPSPARKVQTMSSKPDYTTFPNSSGALHQNVVPPTMGPHEAPTPASISEAIRNGYRILPQARAADRMATVPTGPRPEQGPPVGPKPMQGPPEGPRPMQGPPEIQTVPLGPKAMVEGVRGVGPEVQGPPMGPSISPRVRNMLGAVEPTEATKEIGNILKVAPKARLKVRGVRL